jgi:hypothetical protein
MSSEAVYATIRTHLQDNWTTTPIAWENEVFTQPEPPAPFLFVEITADLLDQRSIGAPTGNLWREMGALHLHLFAPFGTGSTIARTYLRQLVDLFRGRDIADLTFTSAAIGIGETAQRGERGVADGAWWRISASVMWERDLT